MNYDEFLQTKKHISQNNGIDTNYTHDLMFDFQKYVLDYAVKKGRCAVFLDTGLGKTLIELAIAKNYVQHTNKRVLIICPLAVAFQFVKESEKFGIDDVSYSKDGKLKSKIVVCNYERLDKFNSNDFDCVILDESSILKNFDGAIKNQITNFLKKVKYRFLFTATPSPNDYIELGTSSEALGYMGYIDMVGRFFKNNQGSVQKQNQINKGDEYYLKPHAENDFWRWVGSWSISCRKPSDLGFSDKEYELPKLHEIETIIANEKPLSINNQEIMFSKPAVNFSEIKAEVRATIKERCEAAAEKAVNYDCSVYWVNLNDESSFLLDIDKNAVEVKGSMDVDKKEDILLSFSNGDIRKLITKTSITAFGLNWQHCNHTTYFPTYSYEQYYQAIRRFWRFGQKRDVYVDLILSDGQLKIMESLIAKKNKAIDMFSKLNNNINQSYKVESKQFNKQIILPSFLK